LPMLLREGANLPKHAFLHLFSAATMLGALLLAFWISPGWAYCAGQILAPHPPEHAQNENL